MAFCNQCGTRLPGDAVFCPNCGGIPEEQSLSPAVREQKGSAGGAAKKNGSTGRNPIVLTLSVLAVFLVAATVFLWSRAENGHFSPVPRPTKPSGAISGSGYVEQSRYYVTVNGAEQFTDLDGESALRIYFEFTNENRDASSISSAAALRVQASQDGKDLAIAYSIDNEAVNAAGLSVRPGVMIQCGASFKYKPGGGVVDVSIFGRREDKAGGLVSATYLPESLPGAPPAFIASPVDAPDWTEGLSHQGEISYHFVSIYDAVSIRDIHGNPAIRINYTFTNGSAEEISMNEALSSMAYQDGIQLSPSYTEPELEQDAAYYENVAPGDTVLTSRVFRQRNIRSPVEASVEPKSSEKDGAVGRVFEIR